MPRLFRKIADFYALPPGRPLIQNEQKVNSLFKRYRMSVILTLTLGYGFAYTCRLGLSVVKKPLIDMGIFSAEQLGWIGAAYLWGYGSGKVFNGFMADRVNVRRFIPTGLAASAVINLFMGCNTLLVAAIVLWAANGWFQGFLAPSSVVAITHWFSGKKRGTMYGLWSTAHSLGEGLTFFGSAGLVSLSVWNAAFIGPGFACLLVAVGMYFGLRERPRAFGLPTVERWEGTASEAAHPPNHEPAETAGSAQRKLLAMPAVWVIGLASACMYMTRYAINNWGVLYLQEAHGFSLVEAGGLVGLNTIAGIGGCAAYGFMSDKLFGARRPPLTLIFGLLEIGGLAIIFLAPHGNATWLSIGLVLYGFTLSGLLAVLGGLFAVDIAPGKATGAAMGLVGVFSYLGAGIQELISGGLVEHGTTIVNGVRHYDFTWPIIFWVGASIMSMLLAASLWNVKTRE